MHQIFKEIKKPRSLTHLKFVFEQRLICNRVHVNLGPKIRQLLPGYGLRIHKNQPEINAQMLPMFQSFFDRLVLHVNVWTPFDRQQLSMYVPGPRHF